MDNGLDPDEVPATTPSESASVPTSSARPKVAWRRWLWIAGVFAALASLVVWIRGESLQRIDQPMIEAAMRTWAEQGLADYDLVVQLEGRMSGEFSLVIRSKTVVSGSRDGDAIAENRLPRAWSVDGMFETVLADLDMAERAERGEVGGRYVKTLGIVDKELGFLRRYLRIEMMEKGANPEAGWRILSFQAVAAPDVKSSP